MSREKDMSDRRPEGWTDGGSGRRRSWLWWTGAAAVAVLALPVLLIGIHIAGVTWGMSHWSQCAIRLPDGSGRVVFLQRLSNPIVAEFDRKVRLQTKAFPRTTLDVPMDTCGCQPLDVYWYPAEGRNGPHLRFKDPANEWVVDLRKGNVRRVDRRDDEVFFECYDWDPGSGFSQERGAAATRQTGSIARSRGRLLGSITCSAFGQSVRRPSR